MKIENISTISPAKLDQSIQNEAEVKTNANDEEIVYEESSKRYVDRKIIQQFNIWMKIQSNIERNRKVISLIKISN